MNKLVATVLCIVSFNLFAQETLPVATYLGHKDAVNVIDVSSDGKFLISGSKDQTINVWNTEENKLHKTIDGFKASITSLNFMPSNSQLFAVGSYREVSVYSFNRCKKVKSASKKNLSSFVKSANFSKNGEYIIMSNWRDNTLISFEAKSLKMKCMFKETEWTDCAVFSNSGTQVASGTHDNLVKVWDVSSGEMIKKMAGHEDWVQQVVFYNNDSKVISGSLDKTIKIWDASSSKNSATLKGHTGGVTCLAISKDEKYLVSGDTEKNIIVWDLSTMSPIKNFVAHEGQVLSVVFSPDSLYFYSSSSDKTVKKWKL